MNDSPPPPAETRLVLILALVQFVNIVDFMLPSPLGVDFARDLGFGADRLPIVVSSYTLAASITGLLGALFLDRFGRRNALVVCLAGLGVGTAIAGVAWNLPTLLLARVVAGAFGGPATSLAFAIVADAVPVARRGRALGTMMTSFSVASVLGVPIGLELAARLSWHAPFLAVGAAALVVAAFAFMMLPPLRDHLNRRGGPESRAEISKSVRLLATDRTVLTSYLMACASSLSAFVLIPNISAFLQLNVGFPREQLGMVYALGGVSSFIVLRPFGRLVDRFGASPVGTAGTLAYATLVLIGFVFAPTLLPIPLFFVLFMATNGMRNVAYNTLTTRVPPPALRARFQSFQSMVQHASAGSAGLIASTMLGHDDRGALVGIDHVALLSVGIALALPFLLYRVERVVRARDLAESQRAEAAKATEAPSAGAAPVEGAEHAG